MTLNYKLRAKLTSVENYVLESNFLFYKDITSIIKYRLSDHRVVWQKELKHYGSLKNINKEFICFTDLNLNTVLINTNDGSLFSFKGQFSFLYISAERNFALTYESDGKNKILAKREISNLENVQWKRTYDVDFTGVGIMDKNLCFNSTKGNKGVSAFDVTAGDSLWKYYLKDLKEDEEQKIDYDSKVKKILGVFNNELWVALSNEIIALNVSTGELNFILKDVGSIYDYEAPIKGIVFASYGYIDVVKGILYILQSQSFLEYDLIERKVIRLVNLTEQIRKNGISSIKNVVFKNSLIYFTANTTIFPNENRIVGIMNLPSLEILWHTEIESAAETFIPASEYPKIIGDELCILDYSHVLHIFEKE